jgi:hypothetical protein
MRSFALVWEQSGDWLSRTYISINSVSHKYFFGVEPTNNFEPLRQVSGQVIRERVGESKKIERALSEME